MINISEIANKVKEFEVIMDQYFRHDPVDIANESVKSAIDEFNKRLERETDGLAAEKSELARQFEAIRQIEEQVDTLDQKLNQVRSDEQGPDSIKNYNSLVSEYNALVEKHKGLLDDYKTKESAYNNKVQGSNRDAEERKKEIERIKDDARTKLDNYNNWKRNRGPERFFNDLNTFYASLHKKARNNENNVDNMQEHIDSIKKIRDELALLTKNEQDSLENGMLIVEALVGRSNEKCHFIVDLGASVTSLTESMVDVLGFNEHLGEEVELSLPNAIKIKAPQLLIPSITVKGATVEFVKGVVLKESMVGIDGCLGLSFLNHFDCRIEKDSINNKRVLKLIKTKKDVLGFDVFICHKSGDIQVAKEIYEMLVERGYNPFLSEENLGSIGSTEYQKTIDNALESVTHLIVVCSSRKNLETPWVEAEWRLFDGLKRSGAKRGNVIPVLCKDMTVNNLPIALGRYQAISMNDTKWKDELIKYLPRS